MGKLAAWLLTLIAAVVPACNGNGGNGNGDGGNNGEFEIPFSSRMTLTAVSGDRGARYPRLVPVQGGFGLAYTIATEGHLGRMDAVGGMAWDIVVFDIDDGWLGDLVATDNELALVWKGGVGSDSVFFATYDFSGQLTASSTVTDQTNLGTQNPRGPSLAWNGDGYGVAWSSQDLDDAPNPNTTYVFFARIDASGTLVGDAAFVDTSFESASEPSLVWTGTGYGLAWVAGSGAPDVYFANLGSDGALVSGPTNMSNSGSFTISPALVWNDGFGLAYNDDRDNGTNNFDVFFLRIGADGSPLGAAVKVSEGGFAGRPDLVYTGSRYGLVWSWHRTEGVAGLPAVYYGEVSASGERLGAKKFYDAYDAASSPVLASGDAYGMAWHDLPSMEEDTTQILLAIP